MKPEPLLRLHPVEDYERHLQTDLTQWEWLRLAGWALVVTLLSVAMWIALIGGIAWIIQ